MKKASATLFGIATGFTFLAGYLFIRETEQLDSSVTTNKADVTEEAAEERHASLSTPPLGMEEFRYNEQHAIEKCKDEDTEEERYNCISYENSYYDALVFLTELHHEPWMYESLPLIWAEHTSRHGVTNYGLVWTTFVDELREYFKYEEAVVHLRFDASHMQKCEDEWETQLNAISPERRWSMIMYCYNNN